MIERWLAALARFTTRSPRTTLAVLAAVTLGAALLLPRFRINGDIASLLPADHPAVELARVLGLDTSRSLFLTLRGEDIEDELPAVVETLRESPWLVSVDATLESLLAGRTERFAAAPLWTLDAARLDALEQRLVGDGRKAAVEQSRDLLAEDPLAGSEIVQRDPLGLRWVLAPESFLPEGFAADTPWLLLRDRTLALVRVTGEREPFDVAASRALVDDVVSRIEALGLEPPGLIGGYAVARADADRIRHDLSSSLWVSIPAILLFLAVSTRSLLRAHLYLLPVALAVVWALGYGGELLGPLTPLAISAAAILIGLGVDFSIHYAGRLDEERASGDPATAVVRAHVGTGRAILAGMATTVAAFLSFGFGSFPGLFGFGVLLSLGLVFSFVATLTLLPLVPLPARSAREVVGPVVRAAQRITGSAAGRPLALAIVLLAAGGWTLALVRGLDFHADPSFLRPPEDNRAAEELTDALGFSPLPVLVLTPAEVPISKVRASLDALTEEGRVRFSDGAHLAVPGPERERRVAAFRERTAGWVEGALADFEAAGFRAESLRPILEEQAARLDADPAARPADFQVEWRGKRWWRDSLYAAGSLSDPAQREALHAALAAELPTGARVVDPYGLADELAPVLAHDLSLSLAICTVLVLGLVFLWIGEPRAALLALVPVFAGLGVAVGALVLLQVPLHPGNFIAVPLILGLGVDDGIHMVLRARERGGAAAAGPLALTGQAIWRTSATTALGFGSLVTAESPALASLGTIALIGVLVCFATSVLVLPTWLRSRD